ncbi:MAG: type II toxin-antitoxin system VapC family toxin [Alphaproteobacteria bacterium]
MTIVVDASVAMRWSVTLSQSDRAEALLQYDEPIIAPDLVLAEITNAALKAAVFSGASPEAVTLLVRESADYFDELVPAVDLKDRALEIALALKHPAYDCFYLALAEQRECKLVTADERLRGRCARTPFAKLIEPL